MKQPGPQASIAILLCRLAAGVPIIIAGAMKVTGDPLAFSLSIDSFKLLPQATHLPIAYFLPWLELTLGAAVVAGIWVRQSAVLLSGLLIAFTLGLASVLLRGLDVDCGCFGGMFGDSKVTWVSIARNGVFIGAALVPAIFGGGRYVNWTPEDRPEETLPAGAPDAA